MPAGIGVYLCRCFGRISEKVDLERLKSKVVKWKGVSEVRVLTALCRPGDLASVVEDINAGRVDRLVIGACSPAIHPESFDLLPVSGLAADLVERCNLREQCALAHPGDQAGATTQALSLLKLGVARLKAASGSVTPEAAQWNRRVLVVGGGIAGLAAAGNLARGGVEVVVVEKRPWLGGRVAQLHRYYPRGCAPRCGLAVQIERLLQSGRVSVHTLAQVADVHGTAGNFQVNIRQYPRLVGQECTGCGRCEAVCPVVTDISKGLPGWRKAVLSPAGAVYPQAFAIDGQACRGPACGRCVEICPAGAIDLEKKEEKSFNIDVAAIVIATGTAPYDVATLERYGYGRLSGVLTSMDLEFLASPNGPTGGRLIRPADGRPARRVAFIQCAGSRDDKHLRYCSGICCPVTLKQTRYIRDAYPDAEVTVFYMDMRVTGHLEAMYRQVMEEGTVFIRGNPLGVARNEATDDLEVAAADTLSGRRVLVRADLVVLAAGLVPEPIADSYRLVKDGFGFVPGHLPCSPTEGRRAGIFVAGSAQGPMDAGGAIQSALAASAECLALLDQRSALRPLLDKTKCDRCKRCLEECPYGAITLDRDGYPEPNGTACRGCGVCQGGCPLRCICLPGFSSREVAACLEGPSPGGEEVRVMAFLCANDAYRALDGTVYPVNVLPVAVPCAGAVNMGWINDALLNGWDGVIVAGCRPDECHYGRGSELAASRMAKLQETLRSMQVEAERVRVLTCGIGEGGSLAAAMADFVRRLAEMGPSPFKEC